MIKTQIQIGKDNRTYHIPENWLEVKLKDLVNLELWAGNQSDPVGLLSCFLDLDPDMLANSKRDHWHELLTVLSFIFEPPKWHNLKIPRSVNLDNRVIKVPKRLEMQRFGQKVIALQYMAGMKKDSDNIKIIPDVMAVYFQPLIDGKFNRHRLEYIKKLILDMPAIEAVPVGRFFFLKLLKSKNLGQIGLKKYQLIMRGNSILKPPAGIS